MATIQEIRNQYPQYNDMNDQELADSFHDKFYSDMPKSDFYKKIGFQNNSSMIDTFIGELKKPDKDMFNPDEEKINQMALMAMPEGRLISPILKSARSVPFLEKLTSLVAKNHPITQSILKTIGTGMEGSAIGAASDPNDKEQGAALGFGLGLGGRALSEAGSAAYNFLKPSNLLKGNATPEEMIRNLEASRGTKSNLGTITQNPLTKEFYENMLSKLPFSGAHQAMAETANVIKNRGENIVNQYLPENVSPLQFSEKLGEGLIKAKQEATRNKINAYKSVNRLAERDKLKLELPNFSKLAKKYTNSIENTTMLQYEPETKALLNRLKNYTEPTVESINKSKILNKEGQPLVDESITSYPSLQEANTLAGNLNALSKKLKSSLNTSDHGAATLLGNLGKTLKNDIKATISEKGSPKLKTEFDRAEKNYAENYNPFLDKDLLKFTEQNKPPEELIATFLENSKKSDKVTKLKKLMDRLDPKSQDLVRYGYFSRAIKGEENAKFLDPNALKELWTKGLGDNQKRVLVPNIEKRKELDNFSRMTINNKAALELMHNPKTGHILSAKNILKAPFGIAARPIVSRLSSEDYRERLVAKMMEKAAKANQKAQK